MISIPFFAETALASSLPPGRTVCTVRVVRSLPPCLSFETELK
jgi:hypothetical protein